MKPINKSHKLAHVLYDIRGPIMERARQMEDEGQKIIKLNIGNLAVFGFDAPEEVQQDMIRNLPNSAGYSDSKGIFAARKAVMHYTQQQGIKGVTLEDVYLGNGASDLIAMATNALLDDGDELLLPAPDYPLWTAVTSLSGGTPVHYLCDESKGWIPDLDDIRSKITPRTKGIVVINPNNPTGVLYPDHVLQAIVELAREHGLVILADEVYDKVLYDDNKHTALASLSTDVLTLTFNSLSKSYRACGYRAGWMVVSGDKQNARDYIEGLNMLANMRLCSNVPGQWAIQTALGGYQSINDLVCEGGRLRRQRDLAYEMLTAIPGVSCVKPQAALYMFPRLDPDIYPIKDDRQFFLELLEATRVMLVQGTGFNWPAPDHFRMVFLPHEPDLKEAITRIADFLGKYRARVAQQKVQATGGAVAPSGKKKAAEVAPAVTEASA
ncbi:aminotransferase [Bordetella sp. J329]|jgi:alanine-synthesizing transaminase|uniref:pyridoxal phosphate-dependent aminotransferase n=1 Tax=Kerstersia gyiorum TaxID=206506 RepID=UPI000FDCC85A|nr:pyridoxal phosphate-dependent aminotransferase [Kerstersia gyiorum]AZV94816.1 aminotransferase [Bordetella sp. J329]MCH4272377.1 pyridoxal phosphate-dependent aminotransferase [Kerstersia gyiorum]MCI1228638.1 pyridoxal phosphate-dependent aminotransferase [Kerstersia gyiorum]